MAERGITFTRRTLLGLPALLLVRARAQAAGSPIGRVEVVRGTATAELDKDRRALAPRDEIFEGEKLSTADQARLEVRLGKDTRLQLGDTARLKLDRFDDAGGEVSLEDGALLIDKPARSTPQSVAVRSPYARVTVRDSKAFAGPSQGVFGVLAVKGQVTVESGGRSVRLRQGEGTDIKSPGATPSRPRRWGAARVKAALASVA